MLNTYFRVIVGTFILLSVVLAVVVSPYWLWFTVFIGVNLIQSAFTKWCLLETILQKVFKLKNSNKLSVVLVMILLVSCKETKESDYTSQSDIKKITANLTESHPGKKLLETKCYVCHNPSIDQNGRIAPPMVAIKSHYLNDKTTKEEFSNAIWNFVKQPSEDKSKMRGAVRRFALMPYQAFTEKEIKLISEYMYDYKIEEPEWFKKHVEEESKGKMQYRNDGKIEVDSASSKKKT